MSGGFIPVPSQVARSQSPRPTTVSSLSPLLSLSSRQEDRLRLHLDDRILSLERDERKHAFGSLYDLLARLFSLLHLILQIPPLEPWAALRISYLLSFTGSVPTYIVSLPLLNLPLSDKRAIPSGTLDRACSDVDTSIETQASRTMRLLLKFIVEMDRGWMAVLRGDGWLPPLEAGGSGQPVKVDYGGSVGSTERIRLRSIILAGRDKLLAWARTYGNFSGSRFPDTADQADAGSDDQDVGGAWEWENEILGMWNSTLETLADHDFGPGEANSCMYETP